MERDPRSQPSRTPLRASYERVRSLDPAAQLRECMDLLENPDVFLNDVAEAYVLADSCCEAPPAPDEGAGEDGELVLGRFAAGVGLEVTGAEPAELRCLSGAFDPLRGPLALEAPGGLDYVAMQHRPEAAPVLGAVASADEPTPYPVLLRLLCCFTEMATPALLEHWNAQLFKGGLGAEPSFHLHLVLWRPGELTLRHVGPDYFALCELTRDLAELARNACLESPPLGNYLAGIHWLTVDPEDSEGPLAFEWRV